MHARFGQLLWLSLSLVPFYSFASSQDSRDSSFVAVEVTDVSGAEVPTAQIKFVELSTKAQTACPSNPAGKAMCALAPGAYIATVTFPGFRTSTQRINAKPGETQNVRFVLQVGSCPPGTCVEVTPICPNRGTVVVEGVSNSQGKPYEAKEVRTIVTYSSDGQRHVEVVKANLFRDSRGRIRIERFYDGTADPSEDVPMDITIDDNCGTSVILLPKRQTAKVSKMPAPQRVSNQPDCQKVGLHNPPYMGPEGKFEDLGYKLVDGVEVRGERMNYYSSAQAQESGSAPVRVYENWCSILLDTPMGNYILDDNPKRETTSIVSGIKQIEPDPAAFDIPKEYKIVRAETTGPGD
jgi:Carboxypeptidase regulatory-like domain